MLTKTWTISPDYLPTDPEANNYLFLDIETTGFRKDTTILYLIGCGFYQKEKFHIIQWFNDDGISESEMLLTLKELMENKDFILFTFNGESFDIPYLNRHYELNEISFRISLTSSLDLYKILKPFQALYQMEHGRQKDWERFLGIEREDIYDGGQLIQLYKEYLLKKKSSLLDILLLHNMEDIQGMQALSPLLSCHKLLEKGLIYRDMAYCHQRYTFGQGSLSIQCQLTEPLPKALQIHSSMGSVEIINNTLKLTVPVMEGSLKFFFADYQNYYYLPEEDRAVHKNIGCYVEKKYREKAKASNCYVRKTGIYLPFPSAARYFGIEIQSDSYIDQLTLYKTDYGERQYYAEFDALFDQNFHSLSDYLRDWMKQIFICNLRERE